MQNHIRAFLTSLLLIFAITACSEEQVDPLRVGTNVWPGYEPAYLAHDLGYLTDEQVRLSQFQSASESIRAFRNGAVDIVALTIDEALLLVQDGIRLQVFLVADISHGGDVIMARPGIASAGDLTGRKIGVESSALGAYVLARALEMNDVPFGDVELVHLTVDESEQAYISGAVDAVVTFEPYRSRLLREGAREVFSSREMPNEIVDVLVVRSDFAEANIAQLKFFSNAWFKAVNYITEQPEKAAALIGKRLGLSTEEALLSFEGLILPHQELNAELLTRGTPISLNDSARMLGDVLVQHGLLSAHVSMDGIFTDVYIR
jgi:NitT/TauT family transport system substrate-binding protein